MFGAIVIGSTPERSRLLNGLALDSNVVRILRMVETYPGESELARLVNSTSPDVVLLDLAQEERALFCAEAISAVSPSSAIVGLGDHPVHGEGRHLHFCLSFQTEAEQLALAVDSAIHVARCKIEDRLLAFLPGKAGCGSSTIALHTALSLASLNRKVLLIDADLRSGVIGMMLNQEPPYSIQALLKAGEELDIFRVNNALVRAHGADFLLANPFSQPSLPSWEGYFRLLEAVKFRFDHILVDLPELVNPGTREIVQRCRRVFTVCTPDFLSIRLAERRMDELRSWGVSPDRIAILVNQWQKDDLPPRDIEKKLQVPVARTFPNDHLVIRNAVAAGGPVPGSSLFGRTLTAFATELAGLSRKKQEGYVEGPIGLIRRLWKADVATEA